MFKPELLLPAGNVEAFYAALEGGADAIYLGLKDFNARKRAKNFTISQLPTLVSLAHEKEAKLYITLNTVIKNEELPQLYILLAQLSQTKIDAVIIQDWGVYYFIKKFFSNIPVHASTQMAFHNSIGANFGKRVGVERVILARELSYKELEVIQKKSDAELELFVHGALCYSFSGMCLFSSYLGGMSANRGACKQPCRRLFTDNNKKHYLFSLKDNELIDFVPKLAEIGISSLKIEGRMKSADYVYAVARAYRMVLDDHTKVENAKELLVQDVGRDKTSYFIGGNVSEALTQRPNTGLFIGKVIEANKNEFTFYSEIDPIELKRVRVVSPDGGKQESFKLLNFTIEEDKVLVHNNQYRFKQGYSVYALGFLTKKFPAKISEIKSKRINSPSIGEAKNKITGLINPVKLKRSLLYFRIDSIAWLRKIRFEEFDFLVLNLSLKEWQEVRLEVPFIAKNKHKIIAELPKFISEDNCDSFRNHCQKLFQKGITKFMLNHLSQIDLLPPKAQRYASEYVYSFNDAAIAQFKQFKIQAHVYPQETDSVNLFTGQDRSGVVALHYTPQLFYSRMPVRVNNKVGAFKDDTNIDYEVVKRAGMTYTLPQKPVSIFQNKQELIRKGFKQFLIDVCFTHPSQNTFKTLIKRYNKGEQMQPSTSFNYKKGLS